MPAYGNPLPIPGDYQPGYGSPNLVPADWCGRHKTLCDAGSAVKSVFGSNRGCGRGQPGPQDPIWPWGWVYRSTDWQRPDWCEGGRNCDSPRRTMTTWVKNVYRRVHGDALTNKLTDQDVKDLVVYYGAIGKRIYPNNLPCGVTKWSPEADQIRKAALAGLEADLRSGAYVLGGASTPAQRNGGDRPGGGTGSGGGGDSGGSGGGGGVSFAGLQGWPLLVGAGLVLLLAARGGFK